jgi:hypothetical protein
MNQDMLNRRQWLRRAGAAAAVPIATHLLSIDVLEWGREVHAAVGTQAGGVGMDAEAMRVLSAACERVIPTDDTPGAVAAGVPRFIDYMLSNWYDPPERTSVLSGLQDLDRQARARFGKGFTDCTEAQQDTLLLELDAQGARSWFGTAKYLTIWGYYTSEIGITQELQQMPAAGRYDGCAPYAPRTRATAQVALAPAASHGRGYAAS